MYIIVRNIYVSQIQVFERLLLNLNYSIFCQINILELQKNKIYLKFEMEVRYDLLYLNIVQ